MGILRLTTCGLAVAAALGLYACGGGSGGSAASGPSSTGTMTVDVMDAPAKDFDHVWVTIKEIRFNTGNDVPAGDPSWLSYPLSAPVTVDLAALDNGSMNAVFNGITLPAGTYQQIRLLLVPDNATLSASALSAGLQYNDQVNYTDPSTGTSGVAALEIPSPNDGIGLNGTFTVTTTGALNLALDFDLAHDVVKFIHGGNTAYTLKPQLQYYDLAESGAINGQVATANLCSSSLAANSAPTGCAYNLVIKTEEPSADGTYHQAVRFTTIRSDGTFTLYPVHVPAGQTSTTVDVMVRGRNMDTILVRNVPVTAGSTPSSNATTLSSSPLPLTIDTEYTANASTPLNPTGADIRFYQTLSNTGQTELPYEVRRRAVDPFTGEFVDAIPLSTGPIQLGAYVASGTPTLQPNVPTQNDAGFVVAADAFDYTHTVDPTILTGTAAGSSTFSFASPLAVNPSVAVADSISGTVQQTSPASQYDSGYIAVVRMGEVVQTYSLSTLLAQNGGTGGSFTISNLPGGSSSLTLPGAYYYLYARVWNSSNPSGTLARIDFSGYADLRTGSATGMNLNLN